MQLPNFRWIAVLFILLKMNLALGDVTPSYVDIFSVPTTANLIECTEILKENSYCQLEVKSFDPQTGLPEAARKIKGLTVTGGEGYWYAPVYGQKKNRRHRGLHSSTYRRRHPDLGEGPLL